MAEACGLNAVALHARTREDGYTGQARWADILARRLPEALAAIDGA